jgi:uncharacterized membrane protein YgcG
MPADGPVCGPCQNQDRANPSASQIVAFAWPFIGGRNWDVTYVARSAASSHLEPAQSAEGGPALVLLGIQRLIRLRQTESRWPAVTVNVGTFREIEVLRPRIYSPMYKFGTQLAFGILSLELMAFCPAASAGGLAGRSTEGPASGAAYSPTQVGVLNSGMPTAINTYAPINVANTIDNTSNTAINNSVSVQNPVTVSNNIDDTKNIDVQTNIDNTKSIDASSNISVNDSINGANVSFGGNGASINWPQSNALYVIDGVSNFDASVSANANSNFNPNSISNTMAVDAFIQAQQDN